MRRYQLNPPHKETKFTISDLTIYDREDNEIVVDVEFEYDWTDRIITYMFAKDSTTKVEVKINHNGFYSNQIHNIYHECHEHVANRCENTEI